MPVHCLSTKLVRNPDFKKSAIAISIFTKTSDRGDFRDLDAELASIYHTSVWWACREVGARKSRRKMSFGIFCAFAWRKPTGSYGDVFTEVLVEVNL